MSRPRQDGVTAVRLARTLRRDAWVLDMMLAATGYEQWNYDFGGQTNGHRTPQRADIDAHLIADTENAPIVERPTTPTRRLGWRGAMLAYQCHEKGP